MELGPALEAATKAARDAGELLRADFHRPRGPRGADDKADADLEAEELIRGRLRDAFPGWSYLGEETGRAGGQPGAPLWLVDPNDGTRDYLKGRRGSAVSIGLLHEGRPVLGVVFAFGLVSAKGDRDPEGNLRCADPARYRAVPSIAHRLALVAAGEASAAVSLFAPGAWDYAAGQALLRGAGGVLLDQDRLEVSYAPDGGSRCTRAFGGSRAVAESLAGQPWDAVGKRALGAHGAWPFGAGARPRPGETVADPGLLARAQGCLLGQVAGDSLGALVEFARADEVARAHPDGPRRLQDGGVFGLLAGQPTDDSEMALTLARCVLARGSYDAEAMLRAYREWQASKPFDMGHTVRAALAGRPNPQSQANGSLMRASPLAVYAHAASLEDAVGLARADSQLTHPNPVCGDAVAAYVAAIRHALLHGDGPEAAFRAALEAATTTGAVPSVIEALRQAEDGPPVCDGESPGLVLIALRNAFHELLRAESLEAGVVATVRRGGDTDTNAAVAGALLGAVHGREAVPPQWRSMVLSCRPYAPWAKRPRAMTYWPVDVLDLAERLLVQGARMLAADRSTP